MTDKLNAVVRIEIECNEFSYCMKINLNWSNRLPNICCLLRIDNLKKYEMIMLSIVKDWHLSMAQLGL